MIRISKVDDIDEEDYIVISKLRLTKNEYHATIRNKLEFNRLKAMNRLINDQNDANKCKLRTKIYDLKQELDDNQQIVCNSDEFFMNRKVNYIN
jgi:hypothetical protein